MPPSAKTTYKAAPQYGAVKITNVATGQTQTVTLQNRVTRSGSGGGTELVSAPSQPLGQTVAPGTPTDPYADQRSPQEKAFQAQREANRISGKSVSISAIAKEAQAQQAKQSQASAQSTLATRQQTSLTAPTSIKTPVNPQTQTLGGYAMARNQPSGYEQLNQEYNAQNYPLTFASRQNLPEIVQANKDAKFKEQTYVQNLAEGYAPIQKKKQPSLFSGVASYSVFKAVTEKQIEVSGIAEKTGKVAEVAGRRIGGVTGTVVKVSGGVAQETIFKPISTVQKVGEGILFGAAIGTVSKVAKVVGGGVSSAYKWGLPAAAIGTQAVLSGINIASVNQSQRLNQVGREIGSVAPYVVGFGQARNAPEKVTKAPEVKQPEIKLPTQPKATIPRDTAIVVPPKPSKAVSKLPTQPKATIPRDTAIVVPPKPSKAVSSRVMVDVTTLDSVQGVGQKTTNSEGSILVGETRPQTSTKRVSLAEYRKMNQPNEFYAETKSVTTTRTTPEGGLTPGVIESPKSVTTEGRRVDIAKKTDVNYFAEGNKKVYSFDSTASGASTEQAAAFETRFYEKRGAKNQNQLLIGETATKPFQLENKNIFTSQPSQPVVQSTLPGKPVSPILSASFKLKSGKSSFSISSGDMFYQVIRGGESRKSTPSRMRAREVAEKNKNIFAPEKPKAGRKTVSTPKNKDSMMSGGTAQVQTIFQTKKTKEKVIDLDALFFKSVMDAQRARETGVSQRQDFGMTTTKDQMFDMQNQRTGQTSVALTVTESRSVASQKQKPQLFGVQVFDTKTTQGKKVGSTSRQKTDVSSKTDLNRDIFNEQRVGRKNLEQQPVQKVDLFTDTTPIQTPDKTPSREQLIDRTQLKTPDVIPRTEPRPKPEGGGGEPRPREPEPFKFNGGGSLPGMKFSLGQDTGSQKGTAKQRGYGYNASFEALVFGIKSSNKSKYVKQSYTGQELRPILISPSEKRRPTTRPQRQTKMFSAPRVQQKRVQMTQVRMPGMSRKKRR